MIDDLDEIQPKKIPRITQIEVAPWDQDDRKRTYSIIALADDGVVYRLDKGLGGWIRYPTRILSKRQVEAANKEKYAAKYERNN